MSAKNRDNKNRWRNITVGFRVSPEENERINKAVALSGLPKQEYCYRRCLNQDVVVQGNPRVYFQNRDIYRCIDERYRLGKIAAKETSRACGKASKAVSEVCSYRLYKARIYKFDYEI